MGGCLVTDVAEGHAPPAPVAVPGRLLELRPRIPGARIGQYVSVVFGAHLVLFSQDADADRSFLADLFGLQAVDAGGGWLIFALPPAEVAVHPAEMPGAELYLMCDDLAAEMKALADRGVACSDVEEARWGSITHIGLPGGGVVGLYQPRHSLAIKRRSLD